MTTTEAKIMSHIDIEWDKFKRLVHETLVVEERELHAVKLGFYGGFKAGVCAADKIL